jgi:Glycosyl transferase family 2
VNGPEVSVVIPTLDRWALVSQALGCVLAQEDVELEAIVVDDGSTDETPEGLAAIGDPRLRVLRHERPLGVARARNDGLAAARGEWVAFLDDDDLWAPRKLREQLDAAAATGASIAFSATIVLDDARRALGVDPPPAPEGLLDDLLRHNSVPGGCSSVIATTELARRSGGFDERFSILADWDMWIRLAAGGSAAACRQPHVAYVDHSSSMHVRNARAAPRELAELAAKHADLLAGRDIDMGGRVWFLLWVAGGQRRAGQWLPAVVTYLRGAARFRSKGALLRALVAPFTDRLAVSDHNSALRPLESTPPWLVPHLGPPRPQAGPRVLERRIAATLGLTAAEAATLARRARARSGGARFAVRAAAFLVATSPPAARLLPALVRRRAAAPLAVGLLATQRDGLAYAGLAPVADDAQPRPGLLAP